MRRRACGSCNNTAAGLGCLPKAIDVSDACELLRDSAGVCDIGSHSASGDGVCSSKLEAVSGDQ